MITIIFGQCDKATTTEIALGANYKRDSQAGRLIEFLNQILIVCFGSNDRGLSYSFYKQVIAVKWIKNYGNNKPYDPHGFIEEVKIKNNAVKIVAGRFSNETAAMMALLKAEVPALTWIDHCVMPLANQLVWEERERERERERGNELDKAMFYLMNSKNKNAKKGLRLAYFQRNMTAYPPTIKSMARYL